MSGDDIDVRRVGDEIHISVRREPVRHESAALLFDRIPDRDGTIARLFRQRNDAIERIESLERENAVLRAKIERNCTECSGNGIAWSGEDKDRPVKCWRCRGTVRYMP